MIAVLTAFLTLALLVSGVLFTMAIVEFVDNNDFSSFLLGVLSVAFFISGLYLECRRDVELRTDVEITEYRVDTTKVINNNDTTYVYTLNYVRK